MDAIPQDPQVRVIEFRRSEKQFVLADVHLEIQLAGHRIELDSARVLRNRQGDPWLAMPSYHVTVGKGYEYRPAVILSRELKQLVDNVVLGAFEEWTRQQGGGR
jgi:hypothetical protein